MDNLWVLVLIAGVVIAVGVPIVNLSGPTAGSKARRARAAEVLSTLDPLVRREAAALGNVIAIDHGGYGIVHRVATHHKGMVQVSENSWYLAHTEPDDLLIQWVPYLAGGSAGTLRVACSIGALGRPAGRREWLRLLDTVEGVAGDSGRFFSRQLGVPLVPSADLMPGLIVWTPPTS